MIRIVAAWVLVIVVAAATVAEEKNAATGLTSTKPAQGPFVETDRGYMVPYTVTIPGTEIAFEMVPIPGGTLVMGSPQSEDGREDVEGPQVTVTVDPFWMGKTEVTWAEYKQYMRMYAAMKAFASSRIRQVTDENRLDAVTAPTKLYDLRVWRRPATAGGDDDAVRRQAIHQVALGHYRAAVPPAERS
jgi:formylglycine-generating enzyme